MRPFLIVLIAAAVVEAAGDTLLKTWSTGRSWAYIPGLVLWLTAGILWATTLKAEPMAKTVPLFFTINALVSVLIGVVFFHEQLQQITWLGITLSLISIFCLAL